MSKIKKILIANRGEIALRIIRTCKTLGIETVAIYAENDKELPFVEHADQAVSLGAGELATTYLDKEKILGIAKRYVVDAIHPGYGFLSENHEFCELLETAGFIFIGPSSESIRLMGDKIESKKCAHDTGLPVVPGYHGSNQDPNFLFEKAKGIGFPLLIKASAGGGGKGMRIVESEELFLEKLNSAKSEALKFFSNDTVLLEKYLSKPRHIEVQVFGDGFGEARHFFERECSIQRRYQKIVEETPSMALSDELRKTICQTALKLVKGINYRGAGTIEFIFDDEEKFYFLEMNTRLQVEHPISEMITGHDLVALQIQVANKESFGFSQEEIQSFGHSIECRIYAEDPYNNFFPQSGELKFIGETLDNSLRVDSGFKNGNFFGLDYDPMMAKLITHAPTRELAINKMKNALKDYPFLGVKNNRDFLIEVLENEGFIKGDYDTHFIEKNPPSKKSLSSEELALAIGAHHLLSGLGKTKSSLSQSRRSYNDAWEQVSGWIC